MESSGKFERVFLRLLDEDIDTGAFGDGPSMHDIYTPSEPNSKDGYAKDSAVIPKVLGNGKVQTRKGTTGKKKDKEKKKGVNFATGEENEESLPEEDAEKKKQADRCKRRADSVYGKKTSAYKSGAIVRCRQGKIWKKKK